MRLSDVFESGSKRFHARNADAMEVVYATDELTRVFQDFIEGEWGNSWEFAHLAIIKGANNEQLTALYGDAINELTHAQFREWVEDGYKHFDQYGAWPAAGTYVTDA